VIELKDQGEEPVVHAHLVVGKRQTVPVDPGFSQTSLPKVTTYRVNSYEQDHPHQASKQAVVVEPTTAAEMSAEKKKALANLVNGLSHIISEIHKVDPETFGKVVVGIADSLKGLAPSGRPEVVLDLRSDGAGLPNRADPRKKRSPSRSGSLVEARHSPGQTLKRWKSAATNWRRS